MLRIEFNSADANDFEGAAVIAAMKALYPNLAKTTIGELVVDIKGPDLTDAIRDAVREAAAENGYVPAPWAGVAPPPPVPAASPPPVAVAPPPPVDPVEAYQALGGENPGELDADKLPWDTRIHSTPAKKNSDGRWRAKRGVGADQILEVQAELRARPTPAAATPVPAAPPPRPVPSAPPPPPATAESATPAPIVSPPPTTAPDSTPPPPLPPSSDGPAAPPPSDDANPTTFAAIMRKVSNLQATGGLTPATVNAALHDCGLSSVVQLNTNPENIPAFNTMLDARMAALASAVAATQPTA